MSPMLRASLLLLALCACSPAPTSDTAASTPSASQSDPEPGLPQELVNLPNTSWIMNDEAANMAPTIQFTADRASGSTGCNQWSASYSSDGIALIFEDITVTERACPAPAMETEQNFLQVLRDTQGVRTANGEITLDNIAGDDMARFRPLR